MQPTGVLQGMPFARLALFIGTGVVLAAFGAVTFPSPSPNSGPTPGQVGDGLRVFPSTVPQPSPNASPTPRPPRLTVAPVRREESGDPLPAGVLARLGSNRLRHLGRVKILAFSPDGKTLISGGDHRLRIWDVATGKLRHQFRSGILPLTFAFAADGSLLTTSGENQDDGWRLLDVERGTELRRIHFSALLSSYPPFAISPDGKRIVGDDESGGGLLLFDTDTGKQTARIEGPDGGIRQCVLTTDGKKVVLRDIHGTIRAHDTGTGKLLATLRRARAWAQHITVSPDGRYLAVLYGRSTNDALSVWDLASGREVRRLNARLDPAVCLFSPDSKLLAVGRAYPGPEQVSLWDTVTWREVDRLPLGPMTAAAFAPGGKAFAAAAPDGAISIWNLETDRLSPASAMPPETVSQLVFTPDGKRVVGAGREVFTWNAVTGHTIRRVTGVGLSSNGVLSPDGTLIAVAEPSTLGNEMTITLRNAVTGRLLRSLAGRWPEVLRIEFAPGGRWLVVADDKALRVWDVVTGWHMLTMYLLMGPVDRLTISPDGHWLATANSAPWRNRGDEFVRLWNVRTGRMAWRFTPRGEVTRVLHFSPDGRWLAAVSGDRSGMDPGTVQVWDMTTGAEWRVFHAHKGTVWCAVFSPDSRLLAMGASDGSICLWELATGRERHRFSGHETGIAALAFAPDGRRLAASSADAPVYVWDVSGATHPPRGLLAAEELTQCWRALGQSDAAAAFRAMQRLGAAPRSALPFLRERLKPVPSVDPRRVRRLLEALDSTDFTERQKAAAELKDLTDAIAPALRWGAGTSRSAEVRRAVRELLEQLEDDCPGPLRTVRAVEVLERMATPEAVRLLRDLAAGAPVARQTREALAALYRLHRAASSR